MKNFSCFRDNVLTNEKLKIIYNQSMETAQPMREINEQSFLATFSATHTILILAEYHEWISRQSE